MTDVMEGQMDLFAPDGWCGKTFPEPCPLTQAKTTAPSLKKPQKSYKGMPLFLDLRKGSGLLQDSSWETDGVSLGVFMTRNSMALLKDVGEFVCYAISTETGRETFFLNAGEKPRHPIQRKLSQDLEPNPDPRFNLSAKACQGILNRAAKRGKVLPKLLDDALRMQATHSRTELFGTIGASLNR